MERMERCHALRERSLWWNRYMWWLPGLFRELYGANRYGKVTSWIEYKDKWVLVRGLVDEECDNEIVVRDELTLHQDFPLAGLVIGRTVEHVYKNIPYNQFRFYGVYQDPSNPDKA